MINCINKHLKKGGFFWFTVPTFSKYFYNDPTHIRPYNKESINRSLKMVDLNNNKIFEEYYFKFPLNLIKFRNFKITFGYAKK